MSTREALLAAAVMAVLAPSARAQLQFDELERGLPLPVGQYATNAVALGDVDGDGDLDLVFGNYGQQNRLYLNNGNGTFTDVTAARMPVDNDYTTSVAIGDVDGDADLDLVLGNAYYSGRNNRLYLNDGTGTFTDAAGAYMRSDRTQAVALGDLDRDGDLDMVVGNEMSFYYTYPAIFIPITAQNYMALLKQV